MNKEEILTIDHEATKANVLRDGRFVASYGAARGFTQSSFSQILSGRYPFNDNPESVFQKALRVLKKDGYLVQACPRRAAA